MATLAEIIQQGAAQGPAGQARQPQSQQNPYANRSFTRPFPGLPGQAAPQAQQAVSGGQVPPVQQPPTQMAPQATQAIQGMSQPRPLIGPSPMPAVRR